MNYITTTDLRTRSRTLVEILKKGESVSLIHRSKVIGEINPKIGVRPFDADKFKQLVNSLNLPKTSYAKREKIYRKHLMEKYGKDFS